MGNGRRDGRIMKIKLRAKFELDILNFTSGFISQTANKDMENFVVGLISFTVSEAETFSRKDLFEQY